MLSNKLGLGTVQFGLHYGVTNTAGQTPAAEVAKILQAATKNGIQFLDTASAYGNAETILGKNDLSSFNIVSKYFTPSPGKLIEDQLAQTLQDLDVQTLYGYLAHRPADILNDPEQWVTLKKLQQQGFVKKIGFSLNTTEELEELIKKNFIPDLIQVPYNYLDTRFESLIIKLKEQGCEIHTRSVFLQGLFFKNADTLPAFFDPVKQIIRQLQQEENLHGALVRFAASSTFIDKVIIGVENCNQLMQNIVSLNTGTDLVNNKINIPAHILMPSHWPKEQN